VTGYVTKGGYNWTDRYPSIAEAALKNQHRQFVIDGEAVVLGVEVQLYALDILALDSEDLRGVPLSMRKTNPARRPDGIFVAPFEQSEIGPDFKPSAGWDQKVRHQTRKSMHYTTVLAMCGAC
jgi:bifunctional non-homologous end joining protein LigD